jgi:hypothetical protein
MSDGATAVGAGTEAAMAEIADLGGVAAVAMVGGKQVDWEPAEKPCEHRNLFNQRVVVAAVTLEADEKTGPIDHWEATLAVRCAECGSAFDVELDTAALRTEGKTIFVRLHPSAD